MSRVRLDIRLPVKEKELIKKAAALKNITVSSFVIEAAKTKAIQVLSENQMLLDDVSWKELNEYLVSPIRATKELKELLKE